MILHSNFLKNGKEFVDFFKVSLVDYKNNELSENRLKSACTPAFLCHKFARLGCFRDHFLPVALLCISFFVCCFFFVSSFYGPNSHFREQSPTITDEQLVAG